MKKIKKIGIILFVGSYLLAGFSLASSVLAVDQVNFTPQETIPGSSFQQGVSTYVSKTSGNYIIADLLARYISAFYNWGLSIVGVIGVLVLMAAGLIWITSGGDSGKIATAKKMIGGSLGGMTLLIGAWFLLNTINPDLTKLPALKMENITHQYIKDGCCTKIKSTNKVGMSTSENCTQGYFYENKVLTSTGECEDSVCCMEEQTAKGQSNKYLICSDTSKSKCNKMKADTPNNSNFTYKFTLTNRSCATYSGCTNPGSDVTLISNQLCAGKDNGRTVIKKNNSEVFISDAYCYGEKLYMNDGSIGEPCGNEDYSKCDPDKEESGKTCQGDSGGRDCSSGLWCCKFDKTGKRINK